MRRLTASPWFARALWLLALLACALVVARTEFRADFSAFLPRDPTPEQQILVEQLQEGAAAHVLLAAIEGDNPQRLAAVGRHMAASLRQDPLFRQVQNGESAGYAADQALLFSARYLLSPQIMAERFSAAGLRQALQEGLTELSSSTGLLPRTSQARATRPISSRKQTG